MDTALFRFQSNSWQYYLGELVVKQSTQYLNVFCAALA